MTKKQITLGIDSSGVPLLLALNADGKTHSARHSGIKQEEYLFPLLKKLLAKAGYELKDVTNVLFIKGPGRFTGIRIGITLASMLRELIGAKIGGATVFDAINYQINKSKQFKDWLKLNPQGKAVIVLHAFREEYFVCIGSKATWTSFEGLLDILGALDYPVFAAGWDKDGGELKEILPSCFTYADKKINFLQPATMIALAGDDKYGGPNVLEPLYLKPARFEMGK